METLSQERRIMQDKINSLLDRKRNINRQTLERIERDNSMLADYVLPLGRKSPLTFAANGVIKLEFDGESYGLHDNALAQLAGKFEIPSKYLRYLASTEWGRQLAQRALTDHKDNIGRSRVLVRTVGDQARGILSDKYRRLNSDQIFAQFINASRQQNAEIYDAAYTETKSFISTIIPQVFEIPTENNGVVTSVFGARISNSDFGDGALEVRAFQMNVVCLNGMVSESQLREIHLGKRLPDNISFSEKTYQLDTAAMASAVGDIMNTVLSPERIKESAMKIKEASSQLIDVEKEIKKLPKAGMLKEEIGLVEQKLLGGDAADGVQGRPTKWKLSQAITAVSNELPVRRQQELNELAGQLIKL